jgi:hypothetical protein
VNASTFTEPGSLRVLYTVLPSCSALVQRAVDDAPSRPTGLGSFTALSSISRGRAA